MKKLFLLLVAAALTLPSLAEQLTAEQSVARFAAKQGRAQHIKKLDKSGLRLVHTAKQKNDNLYYVFDRTDEGGFLILGADDLVPELIGYTNSGRFDSDHVAPALRWWLSECEKSISSAIATGKKLVATTEGFGGDEIAPLVKSQWSQSGTYDNKRIFNKYCPEVDKHSTPVGCMATAMAQIMRYHKWPEKGTGSISYNTLTHGIAISVNFGNTTYAWDKMLDRYGYVYSEDGKQQGYSFTDEQNDAASLLSYHCGAASQMDYAPEGSGTGIYQAMYALVDNFGYSRNIYVSNRDFFTQESWEELLYSELEAKRPILYTGYTQKQEGHAFVVDGYKNGMFHVNWGWGGMSDGYYTVFGADALHPLIQGTGGSAACDAFNDGHYVLFNIGKPSEVTSPNYFFGAEGDYSISNFSRPGENFLEGDYAKVEVPNYFFNYTGANLKVDLGLRLTNEAGDKVYYLEDPYAEYVSINSFYGSNGYMVECGEVPEGVYYAQPIVRVAGETEWVDIHLKQSVKVQKIAFGNAEIPSGEKDDAQLFCSQVITSDTKANEKRTLNVQLEYPGNIGNEKFSGNVALALFDDTENLVARLEDSKVKFTMSAISYSESPIVISAVIPATVADGHYYVKPQAFQTGSTNWTNFYQFDFNAGRVSYDEVEPLQVWLSGNTVGYTEITTGVDALTTDNGQQTAVYDLQGRITTRQKQNSHIYIIRNKENSQKVW